MTAKLEGVRLRPWLAPAASNRLLSKALAGRSLVSYQVIESPAGAAPGAGKAVEKRASARRRLRLRSGKLLDGHNTFLSECLVRDRSGHGLCLVLGRDIGLPARCRLYDDETGSLNAVATIWRRGALVGMRYCWSSKPVAIKQSDRSALRGRYYAMRD